MGTNGRSANQRWPPQPSVDGYINAKLDDGPSSHLNGSRTRFSLKVQSIQKQTLPIFQYLCHWNLYCQLPLERQKGHHFVRRNSLHCSDRGSIPLHLSFSQ